MADPTALFSEAELRAFMNAKLPASVSTADITTAEDRIRDQFTDITGVYFIPTSTTEYLDGDGTTEILVSERRVTAVTACVIYDYDGVTIDETFDADDLADLAVYLTGKIVRREHGYWTKGSRNVKLTYTHGYSTVPGDIKQAAMMVALSELTYSAVGDRTTSYSDGAMTFQLATAGRTNSWYGLPLVDSVLMRYRQNQVSVS